ncbi:MAG: ACT domain-containing protein [Anaerolineales bacterium]
MATDLTVILEDRPGTLADMGEALGKAGINIDGMCGIPCEGKGVIHILVEDAAGARRALEESGFEVSDEREVLVRDLEDRPGELGEVARKIGDAGVNIDFIYLATNTRGVLGADDLEKARAAL